MTDLEGENRPSVLERLQAQHPNKQLAIIAVQELDDPQEMRQFLVEYAQWLALNTPDDNVRANPIQAAGESVGWALGYFGQKTADAWFNTIEGLQHPDFGRNISYDPQKARLLGNIEGCSR